MTGHEDLETLAALAEGTLPPDVAERVREHLAGCRTCTAAYVDAVRYRAAWLAKPAPFVESASRSPELAHAIRRATGARRAPALVPLAAAALVAVFAGAFVVLQPKVGPGTGLSLTPNVREALEARVANGLVIPGATGAPARPVTELRSGTVEVSPGLARDVDSLRGAYEHARPTPELAAHLVAALLAAGDLDAARDYAIEAVRTYPDDVRVLVVAAAVRDRVSDLSGAEELLRHAVRLAPADPVATLDLALVLRQRGDSAEARDLLTRVARTRAGELSVRARRELATPLP